MKIYNFQSTSFFVFTRATTQSPCLHETLALLSASGACLATTETECRGRDNYEKLAKRVSHSYLVSLTEVFLAFEVLFEEVSSVLSFVFFTLRIFFPPVTVVVVG